MELEKLKELWGDSNNSSLPIDEERLSKILNQKSRRPIALIKRNLKLEIFLVTLFYGFIIWLIVNKADSSILYVDILLLVLALILLCVYAFYKNKLLNKMECVSCEVKSNFNLQLNSLEKLVELYFKVGNISVIFVYLIAGTISYIEAKGDTVHFPRELALIIFIAIGVILFTISYYFGRWFLYQLYGKHIQKLKNILYEMDESDSI